ncbi:MAG: hypothetical protein K2M82_03740 [Lachnospiraceae bacterium]|nr:hypothetical protein [Lachnospiraceae bacterium]
MEYLTVQEVSKLKGCSIQYIKKIILDGKLTAISETNDRGRKKYLIPLSALPDELQIKYYTQHGVEVAASAAPPEKKPPANPQKNLFSLSNAQREEVSLWIRIF